MKNLILIALAVTFALIAAIGLTLPKNEIRTEITIPASPADVWSVLADADAYALWNPFIVEMQGTIATGAHLTTTMEISPGNRQTFHPRILTARSNVELRWLGRAGLPGLFDGEHYFILKAVPEGTHLIHGERFSGLALWFIDTDQFEQNFEAMNAALSERVLELARHDDS